MTRKKIWFVTGASKGLGLSLVQQLLANGYAVAASSRNLAELKKAVPLEKDTFLPLEMDLSKEESVRDAIKATVDTLGGLDVVVNNAGYGQLGALEEISDQEAHQNFEINVFGILNVLRQATPYLREQGYGRVFTMSSSVGFMGNFSGWGMYAATKFAAAGLSESYAAEVKQFGIQVTIVYPGSFRTDFLTAESLGLPQKSIPAYHTIHEQVEQAQQFQGKQPGSPIKAANVLIQVSEADTPPLHLFLGEDAYYLAEQKLAAVQFDMKKWQNEGNSTDFTIEEI
jgi:NAD(P)-dependent dehydrogenase (short-subunit alcohol dehydrogenase family)